MNQGLCARGVAAASLALASTTASAAPPVAVFASAVAITALPSRVSAGLMAEDPTNPVHPIGEREETASRAKPASGDAPELQLQLRIGALVRDHAASSVADEERECLAGAVYFEARGEPLEGQLAVAEVVLNRAASGEYPASICEVVKQPAQFSFVRDGLFPPIDEDSVAWHTAVAVAHIADEKLAKKLSSDVLWYHADYVAPDWSRRLDRVTQIGAHVFYRRG